MSFRIFISYCCLLAYDLLRASASLIALTPITFLSISRSNVGPSYQVIGYSILLPCPAPNIYFFFWGGGLLGLGKGRHIDICPHYYLLKTLKLEAAATSGQVISAHMSPKCGSK